MITQNHLPQDFPLIGRSWLANQLDHKQNLPYDLVVIDASYHLPNAGRNGAAEFELAHIPTAQFFDIDLISDPARADLPHMAPNEADFTRHMQNLGVTKNSLIVVYDAHGLFSAGRVWWLFRLYGYKHIGILNGGLPAWQAAGFPLESGPATTPEKGDFEAKWQGHLYASQDDVYAALDDKNTTIIDMRGKDRFDGKAPEPRPGLRCGHIPSAVNFPFTQFSDPDTKDLQPLALLANQLANLGVTPNQGRYIASCGSGVSAPGLAFIMALLGDDKVAVYDGSWAQWGRDDKLPIATN